MRTRRTDFSSSAVGLLSLASSLITVGVFLWHFIAPHNQKEKPLSPSREPFQHEHASPIKLQQTQHRAPITVPADTRRGAESRAVSPHTIPASYRLHQNETTRLSGCNAVIGAQFARAYGTAYTVLTVTPSSGAGASLTVMGPNSNAVIHVLTVNDREQFLDIALSLQPTEAKE
jgi:hypothetical protein